MFPILAAYLWVVRQFLELEEDRQRFRRMHRTYLRRLKMQRPLLVPVVSGWEGIPVGPRLTVDHYDDVNFDAVRTAARWKLTRLVLLHGLRANVVRTLECTHHECGTATTTIQPIRMHRRRA